jgi:hypothetical protein
LIALSFDGTAAAAEMAAATDPFTGGVEPPLLLSLPQPDTVARTRAHAAHQVVELFIGYSINSSDSAVKALATTAADTARPVQCSDDSKLTPADSSGGC